MNKLSDSRRMSLQSAYNIRIVIGVESVVPDNISVDIINNINQNLVVVKLPAALILVAD